MDRSVFFRSIRELQVLNGEHPVWERAARALSESAQCECLYTRSLGDSLTYWTQTLVGVNSEYVELGSGTLRRHRRYRTLVMPLDEDVVLEVASVQHSELCTPYRETEDLALYEGRTTKYQLERMRIACLSSDVVWRLSGSDTARLCLVRVTIEAPAPRSTYPLQIAESGGEER